MASDIPYRDLGSTGERVSIVGLGGWHLGFKTLGEDLAIRIIRTALDRGINFLDNSWDYNDGESEIRVGKALRDGYRQKAFVMTKIDGRSRQEATRQLDESLRRFGINCIDLVQHHEVIRFEDPDRIFHEEGAHAALVDAQKAGKLRFIGFTGHKDPHVHLYMLEVAEREGVHFDTVQMPINVMDAHYRSFTRKVVPEAVRRRIGILGMKSMANGIILRSNTVTALECLHFAMNQQTSTVITGVESMVLLDQAIEAATTFRPMSDSETAALLARTAQAAARGEFEPFKTSTIFDATATNPKVLGEEPKSIRELVPA